LVALKREAPEARAGGGANDGCFMWTLDGGVVGGERDCAALLGEGGHADEVVLEFVEGVGLGLGETWDG
jgi:hypothetical protein